MELEASYVAYKPLLYSIAYRMLGSAADAEDAVQDVFLAIQGVDTETVDHPKAYLARMITNDAINKLKSAKRARETYIGPWLPEPQIAMTREEAAAGDPAEELIRRESFGYAWLVMLEKLTPPERAVFVLRESLRYDYTEIAELLDRSEPACRKLFSRAKAKLGQSAADGGEAAEAADVAEPFVRAFAEAAGQGRFEPLVRLLTDDAVLVSDGGGKVRAALHPILGKDRIIAFFRGIRAKGSLEGEIRQVWINGQLGLLILRPDKPPFAISFEPEPGGAGIRSVYLISNPDKLTRISG